MLHLTRIKHIDLSVLLVIRNEKWILAIAGIQRFAEPLPQLHNGVTNGKPHPWCQGRENFEYYERRYQAKAWSVNFSQYVVREFEDANRVFDAYVLLCELLIVHVPTFVNKNRGRKVVSRGLASGFRVQKIIECVRIETASIFSQLEGYLLSWLHSRPVRQYSQAS